MSLTVFLKKSTVSIAMQKSININNSNTRMTRCIQNIILVDASEAGAGNLEIIVRCAKTGQRIPNFLEAAERNGKFRIFFTPKPQCFQYKVDVTFNDEQVAGKCDGE